MKRGQNGQLGLAEAFMAKGLGSNARLEKITGLVDWSRFDRLLSKVRPGESGRPTYRALAMFKALLLQQWYGFFGPCRVARGVLGVRLGRADAGRDDDLPLSPGADRGGLARSAADRTERPARGPRPDAQARHHDRCHTGGRSSQTAQ